MSQRLLRPQVALGGLDRGMAEEKLDLLQLPARLPAQFGAGPAQVVRRELAQIGGLGITHHQAPDCLFVPDLGSHDDIALVHGPEDAAGGNSGSAQPGVDPGLDPRRHGHGPYPVPLAGHVRQHPPSLALLEIFDVDAEELRAAQAAPEEHSQDGPVALAGQGLRVRRIQQMVGLVLHQPVPYPRSLPLYSRNPLDRRRRRRVEHLAVSHLPGQLADRRKPEVDGGRG
jgi:hypothetical protein